MFSLQNYPEQPPLRKKAAPSLAASFRGAFFWLLLLWVASAFSGAVFHPPFLGSGMVFTYGT